MFDYLLSKMVWIVAAIILTASVIGLFTWQNRSLQKTELEEQVENISGLIEKVSNTDSKFNITISFSDESYEYYFDMPSQCDLNFTTDYIYYNYEETKHSEKIYTDIYLFNPVFINKTISTNELDQIQENIFYLEVDNLKELTIKSKKIGNKYRTFVYPLSENQDKIRNKIREVGNKIKEFYRWNFSTIQTRDINKTREITVYKNLIISTNFLILDNDSIKISYPINKLHLWRPNNYTMYPSIIESKDDKNRYISVKNDTNITLKRKRINVNGREIISFFLYN